MSRLAARAYIEVTLINEVEFDMNHNIDTEIRNKAFESGAPVSKRFSRALLGAGLLASAMAAPAYAATVVTVDQVQPLLLIGSGVLLVVALALKAVSKRHARDAHVDPDITRVNIVHQTTGTIGDYRISRPWNR